MDEAINLENEKELARNSLFKGEAYPPSQLPFKKEEVEDTANSPEEEK